MLNNFLFNSSSILTDIKNPITPFSSVFSPQGSEQHFNTSNVFFFLLFLYSHFPTVDSLTADSNKDFDDLLFYFVYGSSSSPPFPSFSINNSIDITISQKEFKAFTKLSFYVFFSSSSFYYLLC
jgi:hypothetical protein